MQKLINSLSDHRVPISYSRDDWKQATIENFSPYFRRPTQLQKNIDSFIAELRNLARIARDPDYLSLLRWSLSLYRKVLRVDRAGAYRALLESFDGLGASDAHWLHMFQTTSSLEAGAAARDVIFQIFETIGGIAEGCFKPQLQILYSFAVRDVTGTWPVRVTSLDFGALVGGFPESHRTTAALLLRDPDLDLTVNQWRNISAHKSYRLIGPKTIRVTFGKGTVQSRQFGLNRLRAACRWVQKAHHALRLANTIIFIEHAEEILALGPPKIERSLASSIMQIAHDLSTVGYETISWKEHKKVGTLLIRDTFDRPPTEALIHASQQLVALSIGVLFDVSKVTCISKTAIQLQLPDGKIFGTAMVLVATADAFSLGKINLRKYMDQIEWNFPGKDLCGCSNSA
ncbi:hypothetical protein SAMN05192549_115160 [Duganella sacchari]|uniref:Uncharacterized protein n=1 Tax=Duganella sacchari TaxID=551987 RepID=A0A1M7RA54_9BURK|nr:hypothetical protein [Duganella sacchari]SHN43030.1 hypothetical protein SAMN05192549_115160 [Duganella sacchari]